MKYEIIGSIFWELLHVEKYLGKNISKDIYV